MAQLRQHSPYRTPERKSPLQSSRKDTITTAGTKFTLNYQSPQRRTPQRYEVEGQPSPQQQIKSSKNDDLQRKVARLRVYLVETAKISKKAINHIFGWGQKQAQINEQKKLLRELGAKVQVLLKENQELRHYPKNEVQITEECQMLSVRQIGNHLHRKLNKSLQRTYTSNNLQNKEEQRTVLTTARKHKDVEQLIAYEPVRRSNIPSSRVSKEEVNHVEQQDNLNKELMNIEKVKTLKKYFTVYINTCIEQNDEKFHATQNYIKSLENRVAHLQKMEGQISHMKFEKEVRLQNAMKMTKNISIAGPNVAGDVDASVSEICQELHADNTKDIKKEVLPLNYFVQKPKLRKITDQQLQQEFLQLREENKKLQEQNRSLKKKYQLEVESNIKTRANYELLLKDLQFLTNQNTSLKSEMRVGRSPKRISR